MLPPTDRKIVAALRADARMSVTDLSQRIGVSRATAKARLDALIAEGRIRRFTIETDTDQDSTVRAITLVELQGSMSRKVIKTLSSIAEVTHIYATNGAWDLVVEIRTDNLADFDRVLREVREVPGVLNSQSSILLTSVGG
ncbi:Lrp/AsnC family transcriptional regulator [Donghicola eburneus]|uniref:Lrp/AsnC family transcriptional regulator n=1 Tax=Donghicola eburneus TaxID=393278 RepID=UPI0008F3E740|nr:Lrp/AsnC family transcriptional regulator [Donghicola eburneus]SFQ78596.1 DNA-binding transcriptional regulator, Lrp family [Donghicola eburneus]